MRGFTYRDEYHAHGSHIGMSIIQGFTLVDPYNDEYHAMVHIWE